MGQRLSIYHEQTPDSFLYKAMWRGTMHLLCGSKLVNFTSTESMHVDRIAGTDRGYGMNAVIINCVNSVINNTSNCKISRVWIRRIDTVSCSQLIYTSVYYFAVTSRLSVVMMILTHFILFVCRKGLKWTLCFLLGVWQQHTGRL